MVSFYSDMQRIEQAYGPLSLISIKNRKRYENINKSELNIRKIIYDWRTSRSNPEWMNT